MNYFSRTPLLRLIMPLLSGIIVSILIQFPVRNLEYVLIFLFTTFTIYSFSPFSGIFKYRWISGLLISLFLFASGYHLATIRTEIFRKNHFSNLNITEGPVLARVVEPVVEKEKSFKTILRIVAVKDKNNWKTAEGNVLVYFQKDSKCNEIRFGDLLFADPLFENINSPSNPGEFDYKKYLSYKGIYQQAFLGPNNWEIVNEQQNHISFIETANNIRNNLLRVFSNYGIEGKEFAVVSALMMGYKDKLDADLKKSYSDSGAMHVLAVSGLHVGIIYLVLNFMLIFLDKTASGILIKAILLLIALWSYALLTGLSPSVLRATTMFSFIIAGKAFNRNANIYNTLAASAFLLLLYNPYLIMELGFQLSYLAVVGIVFLQPKIYAWFQVDNWFLDKVWALTSVSLAAQLATFPLGLLYFHQFPNYFLIANLIVIPAAAIIIYSGIALLILSGFDFIAQYLAVFLNLLVKLLNEGVRFIEKLPFSITEEIYINVLQTLFIYFLIVSLISFFILKRAKFLVLTLLVFILFLSIGLPWKMDRYEQKKLIVYNMKGHSVINFVHGSSNILITDLSMINNRSKFLFHVKNNLTQLGIHKKNILHADTIKNRTVAYSDHNGLFIKDSFIKFHAADIIWINDKTVLGTVPERFKIKLDYVIVSNNPPLKIRDILKNYHVKEIIIDSSNSNYKAEQFAEQCSNLGIKYHLVHKEGAFIRDI